MPLRALAELRRASLPYVASAQQSYECLTYVQYTDNIVFPPIVEQTLKNRSQMDHRRFIWCRPNIQIPVAPVVQWLLLWLSSNAAINATISTTISSAGPGVRIPRW